MSWAVRRGLRSTLRRSASRPNRKHPFDYGSFEGVFPGQYGAGEVIVWDCGVYSPTRTRILVSRPEEAERASAKEWRGKARILLRGEKVKGSFALVRTKDVKNCSSSSIRTASRPKWT